MGVLPHPFEKGDRGSNIRIGTCNEKLKAFHLLLFRQKQQNHRGPRTRPDHTCINSFGVSAVLISLPLCRAALPRNRLHTAGLLHPMPFPALLHAARGADSDMRGPRERRPDGRRVKRPLPGSGFKRPAGPPGAVLSEPGKWSGVTAPDTPKHETASRPGGHSAPASPRTAGSV